MRTDESAQVQREQARLPRKELVVAAEHVIEKRFEQLNKNNKNDRDKNKPNKPEKTQFSNLIGLCNEAQCAEEITNYLRYQAGRGEWDMNFTKNVINSIEPILKTIPEDRHVGAWKLYATYMKRAYVYQIAVTKAGG